MDALAEKLRRKRQDIETGADPLGPPVEDFDGEELAARSGIKDPLVARHIASLVMGQKPAQEGPDALGLLQAQKQAAGNRAWTSIQQGADIAGAAIGGTKPLTDVYAERLKSSDQPVADFADRESMRRQGVSDERAGRKFELEVGAAERKVEIEGEERDPASPLSRMKREGLRRSFPKAVEMLGADFDRLSSAQIDSMLPWAREALNEDLTRAKMAAYGRKGSGAAKQPKPTKLDAEMAPRAITADWEAGGEVPVTEDDVKKFKVLDEGTLEIRRIGGELKKLIDDNGPEIAGKTATVMDAKTAKLKIAVKNMEALGAITKDDSDIILGYLPDLTSFAANVNPMGKEKAQAVLKELLDYADGKIQGKARQLGLRPRQAQQNQGGQGGLTVKEERVAPDGRVIQMLSDGTKRVKP